MAKRKRRKRGRLKSVFLFVLTPIIIWILAFFTWLYWNDIVRNFTPGKAQPERPAKAGHKQERKQVPVAPDEKMSSEEIREEDRNRLDEIIRRETR